MKTILSFLLTLLLLSATVKAQPTPWYLTGNAPGPGNFIGSTTAADLPFETNNTEYMRLMGVAGTNQGWLGLNTSTPASVLHIDGNLTTTGELFRTVSPAGTQSYWRMFDNTNEIFNINGTNAGAVTLYSMATGGLKILSSSTTAPILIQSAYNEIELGGVGGGSPLLTTGTQYLRIGTSVVTNQTDFSSVNVGVGELFDDPYWSMVLRKDQPGLFPGSTCLQFENNVVTHIGQFTGFTMGIESDGDAILQQNEDNYQISFLTTPVTHATDVGPCVERMRIESSGEVGIGNYRNIPYIPPTRRLEVLDNGLDSPQFRLTYTQNANVNLGIHTDFQTTSLGDLYINPFDGTNNRKVGINTSTPVATLEVFDASSIPKLRLTDTLGKKFTDFLSDASGNLTIDPVGTTSAYGNMGYVQICPLFLGANPNLALIVNGQENIYTVSPNDTLSNILVWNPATTTIERRNANTFGNVSACTTAGSVTDNS